MANKEIAFKTWFDDKKEKVDNWFILGLNTDFGQITYHLPSQYWDMVDVEQIDLNSDYDGHNSQDVIIRLMKMLA
jgi:hypothetical protein